MADTAAVALTNGQAATDQDQDAKKEVVDEKIDDKKEDKNPGKALIEYLEKIRSPLSAVYQKRKDTLLEILAAENYTQLKALREKERQQAEDKRIAEKLEEEKRIAEKLEEEKRIAEKLEKETREKSKQDTNVIEDVEEEDVEEEDAEEEDRCSRSVGSSSDNEDEEDEDKKEKVPYAAEKMALNQAMVVAITTSQPEMLQLLLKAGADPNAFDKWYPVIHTIADMRNIKLFHVVKNYVTDIAVESYYGNLLHASARAGSLELLKDVYDLGVTKMIGCKANGSTPLHDAVRCVPSVCDSGNSADKTEKDESVNNKESEGETQNNVDKEKVPGDGISVDGKENSSKNGNIKGNAETETPQAVSKKSKFDFRIIEFLLDKGCSVHAKDSKSKTPLHEAAIIGNKDLINVLLKAGAKKTAIDGEQNTPWLYSAIYGHSHLFDVLLDVDDIDESFDANGSHYIHKVAQLGKLEALRFLMSKGANQLLTNSSNQTPLHLAVQNVHIDCVKEFLNQPDPGLSSVNASEPFKCALRQFIRSETGVLELFLAKGQDINVLCQGKTPLLHNIGHENVLEWLLKHGADPDYITPSGEYALMAACERARDMDDHDDAILRLLLRHNADVTKTHLCNDSGLTPLQMVIVNSNYHHSQLCLVAGFSLCKLHDWLQMEEDTIKVIVNDSPSFQDLIDYIKMNEYGPVSLKGLCRLKALKCLGCIDVEQRIKQLGLPPILEDYLSWEKYLALRTEEYSRCVEHIKSKK